MKYMFLVYLDEAKFAAMSKPERDAFVNGQLDYDDELRAQGHFVSAEVLKAPSEAATVRRWEGPLMVTDGPFMETKEHLGGYLLVEARDLNQAILLAGRMPLAAVGSIEVRPLDTLTRIA